jgi:hypothetical protein
MMYAILKESGQVYNPRLYEDFLSRAQGPVFQLRGASSSCTCLSSCRVLKGLVT